jgi:hypothetical protein
VRQVVYLFPPSTLSFITEMGMILQYGHASNMAKQKNAVVMSCRNSSMDEMPESSV